MPSLSSERLETQSSPYINHFTQPDGIVPDPYNPQDWNRYSYVRNNPLKYNDPTGHKPMCEEDPASCKKLTPAEELKAKIKDQYNWDIKGSFTLKELKTIYQTGQDIETYVDGISGGKGQEWMLRMLGNTTIEHGYFDDGHSDAWPFLGNNFESRIRLNENWLNDGWGAKVVFAHELGHIYDTSDVK